MQLLHEDILSAQKKRQNVGIATAVQIKGASSSPSKPTFSGTAHEMADMINSSRSTREVKEGLDAGKVEREVDRALPGKLRKVAQAGDPHEQRYSLRSKTDDTSTQKRTAKHHARPDTYDIDSTPEHHPGSGIQDTFSQKDSEDQITNSHQERKNTIRKSKRTAAKRSGLTSSGRTKPAHSTVSTSEKNQSLNLSFAEASDTDHQSCEKEKEEPLHNSTSPVAGEKSTSHRSKLASGKAYGRPRKVHNKNSLTLRQSQAAINNKISDIDGNRRLGSPKISRRRGSAHVESSHEDHIIEVHRDNETQNSTHDRNINIDLARHRKCTSKQPNSTLDHNTLRHDDEQDLEFNETIRGRSRQLPEDRNFNSNDESIQSNEEFRPEDMFGHGNELNAVLASALELSMYGSGTASNISSNGLQSSLLDDLEGKFSKLRTFVKQQSFDKAMGHSEHITVIENFCSEISSNLHVLAEETLRLKAAENALHKVYARVMPIMAFTLQDLLLFFGLWDSEEEELYLERFGLDIFIELARCLELFYENTASIQEDGIVESEGFESKADTFQKIIKPLKKVCKTFEEERDELLAAEEMQASSIRRREEIAYQERRKARLRERRERAEARRDEWHSLHVARLAAEPDPRRFPHLRLKELASDIDLDANGELFERLELFAPRTQASPAVPHGQHVERIEWTDAELAALLDGLKKFTGPSVFYDIFATYCGPSGPLRSYNVQQITRKAAYLRRILLQANLTQSRESEHWINSIPIYE